MIKVDKKWGDPEYWLALGQMVDPTTMGYYLNAVDLKYDSNKNIVQQKKIEEFIIKHGLKLLK